MENKLKKIDSVVYSVSDLAQAEEFYTVVLGLKKAWTDKERGMIGFLLGDGVTEIVIQNDPSQPKFDYSYSVENVEEYCKEFVAKGYELAMGPIDVRCGKYAVLLDPDGNKLPIIDLTKFEGEPRYDHYSGD